MKSDDHPPSTPFTRRRFLHTLAAVPAAVGFSPLLKRQASAPQDPPRKFRFVFMPCIHLRRDLRSPEGFAAALQAVRKLSPAPDFILTGGDMCHNLRDQSLDASVEVADMFVRIYNANSSLPAKHCLGNHDLAAWNKVAEAQADPRYGKQLVIQKLGMPGPYYAFGLAGWRFLVLDYLRVSEPGKFTAEIDADQLAWMRDALSQHPAAPTIVVTHAPVVSAVELFSDRAKRTDDSLAVPFGRVISNAAALLDAAKSGNVRAFISGHLHLVERLEFLGNTFICSGSVSGHQWTGPRLGTPEGFGVFDCSPDGSFNFQYHAYGWKRPA